MHAAAPAPPGDGRGDVVGVGVAAVAEHLAVDAWRREPSACSNVSSTMNAAPSAITKPSRAASKGRDARVGIVVAGAQRAHAGEAPTP